MPIFPRHILSKIAT